MENEIYKTDYNIGESVAFNKSGKVSLGTVVKTGKVKKTMFYNFSNYVLDVHVQAFDTKKISKIKNPKSIISLTDHYEKF